MSRPSRWMKVLEILWEVFTAVPLAYLWVRLFALAGIPGALAFAAGVVPLLAGGTYLRYRIPPRHRRLLRYPWVLWSRRPRAVQALLLGASRSYPYAAAMAVTVLAFGPGLEGYASSLVAVGTFLLLAVSAWAMGVGAARMAALRPGRAKGVRGTGA